MTTSVVVIERTVRAEVNVSHPDEWTQEDVDAAVATRQSDIVNSACMWGGTQRTVVVETRLGESVEMESEMVPEMDPVELVDEDIDGGA